MRGKKAKKRITQTDPIYKSKVVERFINLMMFSGKKSLSRQIVYTSLEKLNEDKNRLILVNNNIEHKTKDKERLEEEIEELNDKIKDFVNKIVIQKRITRVRTE